MKILALMMVLLLATGCGSPWRDSMGAKHECYGLLNKDEVKPSPAVDYAVVTGNVVWSVLLAGTIFVPVWLVGYELYCPANAE